MNVQVIVKREKSTKNMYVYMYLKKSLLIIICNYNHSYVGFHANGSIE